MNTSRSSKCACNTKSALDKNLKAKANSKNPKTTLTELSQPPDLGNELSQPGNAANNVKGKAIANEKPNIPTIGPTYEPPEAASTSKVPTIGPVHEKDTRAKVNAIKKIPIIPPRLEAESALLIHEFGILISKAPRNEAAKIIKSRKKARLK